MKRRDLLKGAVATALASAAGSSSAMLPGVAPRFGPRVLGTSTTSTTRKLAAPAGALRELPELRNLRSKVWHMGGARRHLIVGMTAQHAPQDVAAWLKGEPVAWDEVDDRATDNGATIGVANAWYTLAMARDRFAFDYVSKIDGHRVTVELVSAGSMSAASLRYEPKAVGNYIVFEDAAPDLDLLLQLKPHGVETWKRLKGPRAPREFEWRITEDAETASDRVSMDIRGHDNEGMIERGQRRKRIGLEIGVLPGERTLRDGRHEQTHVETWTGRLIHRDPDTRVLSLRDDAIYPVLIDASISEAITADNDDGTDKPQADTWNALFEYYYGGEARYLGYPVTDAGRSQPGWRFLALTGIASGDTVNSATLTINCNTVQASGVTANIYGVAADSAAEWSNTVRPELVTGTTATVSQAMTTMGSLPINVATIVQEVVNRSGWSSGNNLALYVGAGGSGDGRVKIDEIDAVLNVEATLAIDYTGSAPAAATLSSPTPSGTLGTSTTATIGATTDTSSGTLYVVVDSAANISSITAAQVKAGHNNADAAAVAAANATVSTTSPSAGVTGLTASTGYSYAAVQNSTGGDSNVVTGTFTTADDATAVPVFMHHYQQMN